MITNREAEKSWFLGYMAGALHGISLRSDIPDEVREICEKIVARYTDWSNKGNEEVA